MQSRSLSSPRRIQAQGQREPLGELAMAQVAQVGQADHLALLVLELPQALVQRPGLLAGQAGVQRVGCVTGERVGQRLIDLLREVTALGRAAAQAVE